MNSPFHVKSLQFKAMVPHRHSVLRPKGRQDKAVDNGSGNSGQDKWLLVGI